MTSLEGGPTEILGSSGNGHYSCSHNKLISLSGCPSQVNNFYCSDNKLTSLSGCPEKATSLFFDDNELTSLSGSPEEVGGIFTCNNNKLTSLSGGPKKVGGDFSCARNNLTDLQGMPIVVGGNFSCGDNNITSLEGYNLVHGSFNCRGNPIYPVVCDFIKFDNKNDLIELFNDTDIIRDGDSIIWDRFVWFYEEIGVKLPNMNHVKNYYKIIE